MGFRNLDMSLIIVYNSISNLNQVAYLMKIVVTKRSDDYHACLEINSRIWGCGKTPDEAIGKLITTHADMFNIEIEVKQN